jgi:hypothetical protein
LEKEKVVYAKKEEGEKIKMRYDKSKKSFFVNHK